MNGQNGSCMIFLERKSADSSTVSARERDVSPYSNPSKGRARHLEQDADPQ